MLNTERGTIRRVFLAALVALSAAGQLHSGARPPSPCVLSQLGAAGSLSILGLSGAQIAVQSSIPGGGSVGIGAEGTLHIQGNTTLNNPVYADPSAKIQLDGGSSITGTTTTESFTGIQNAAVAAAAAFAALTPTQTFSQQIQSATVIMGNGGQNVISLANQINLNGQNLTLTGGPRDPLSSTSPRPRTSTCKTGRALY